MRPPLRSCGVVLIVLAMAANARAQELAGSFDQLRVLVKVGDRVRISDASGREVSGTIADLGPASLALTTGGARRDFREDQIDTIRQRRPDPLSNGARWGLLVGGGFGLLTGAALVGDGNSAAVMIPIMGLAYGGIGAGVGAGLDALLSAEQVIYARRRASRVRVAPLVSRQRKAVLVSLAFERR